MSCVIGIDPGLDGGISIVAGDLGIDGLVVMPTRGTGKAGQREVDWGMLAATLKSAAMGGGRVIVAIEKVSSMPGQGVSSMFKFGGAFEGCRAVAESLGLPVRLVRPAEWQKRILVGCAKGDSKAAAVAFAKQRWPGQDFRATGRCSKPHSGLVDATCLALYVVLDERGLRA